MPLLSVFGELETFISDNLYPYRYVLTPIVLVALATVAFVTYQRGVHLVLWRHRLATTVVGAPLLVVVIVLGNYLVSPLWERSHLDEASPLATEMQVDSLPGSNLIIQTNVFEPGTTHKGMFRGADDFHFGRGDALIIEASPSSFVLRFENFSVRNGPDLYVYLSREENGKHVDEMLNLGKLKATDGAFNYEIPPGVDLASVKSVIVWCRQFDTLFAVAALVKS